MSGTPVHFMCSAPFDVSPGQLVFYDVVDASITSRSSVLSCLAEAGGEAKLPDSVTVSDFRKWLEAVTDNGTDFNKRRFGFMCSVIKVADAIDDEHASGYRWMCTAAKFMRGAVLGAQSENVRAEIIEGLSLLPAHLQHRLLEGAEFQSDNLQKFLMFLPAAFHATLLTKVIESDTVLRIPIDKALPHMVKALKCLPTSPPSVLSFKVHGPSQIHGIKDISDPVPSLSSVLSHHTGLTSLTLPSWVISSTSHSTILSATASLKSLMMLKFEEACPLSSQRAATLKQALSALPRLHSLELHLTEAVHDRKRQRDAEALSQVCLADVLSPATALTSLDLCVSRSDLSQETQFFTAAKPLVLPSLLHLRAFFGCQFHLAAAFFSQVSAPLTSLDLSRASDIFEDPHAASTQAVLQFIHSLSALTRLRRFCFALPLGDAGRFSTGLTSALPPLLTGLHRLQDCALTAERGPMLRAVQALASCLTRLHLEFEASSQNKPTAAAWSECFDHLCSMKLQHLEIAMERDTAPDSHGLSSLSMLTQLTVLHVRGWNCLRRPADGEALARMTHLQRLQLEHEALQLPRACLASLSELRHLTSLTLKYPPERSDFLPDLIDSVPPDSLSALREMDVVIFNPFDSAEALGFYAEDLPALERLVVQFHLVSSYDHDVLMNDNDDDEYESEYGLHYEVHEQCERAEKSLQGGADGSGFELVLDRKAIDRLR